MQNDRPMTMNDRVALARHKRIKSGDIWPGDLPWFDGSVRHDASPEYVGSRDRNVEAQINRRPGSTAIAQVDEDGVVVAIPSARPVVIRLVDVKVRESHPCKVRDQFGDGY